MYEDEPHIMDSLRRDTKLAVRLRFVPIPTVKVPTAIAVSPDSPNLLAFINLLLEMEHVRPQVTKLLGLLVAGRMPVKQRWTAHGKPQTVVAHAPERNRYSVSTWHLAGGR